MKTENNVETPPPGLEKIVLAPLDLAPPAVLLRAGDLCPMCKTERLDYDGLLNLSCPKCGPVVSGCFT